MRVRIILFLPALPLLLRVLPATGSANPVAAGSDKSGSRSAGGASSGLPWAIGEPDGSARGRHPDDYVRRLQRNTTSEEKPWISTDAKQADIFFKSHAFVVRDENIPECGAFADKVTKERFFMCSGAVLNKFHVITSASCINSARFHKRHLGGDLAVLIGALEENSHVIKILQYEVHPNYEPEPSSIDHPKYNLAILTLACPMSRQAAVVPKLPSTWVQDVGHLCCSGRCKLSTVIENSKNQNLLRLMKTQHLPDSIHASSNQKSKRSFLCSMKLPPRKRLNRYIRQSNGDSITNPPDESTSVSSPSPDNAVSSESTTENTTENPTESTTENTTENIATDTPENTAADTTENTATSTTENTATSTKDNTAMSTEKINNNEMAELMLETNVSCPPLGSPVIYNGTLIALIAYTCSDEQNWVPWKYVNLIENIEWINSEKRSRIESKRKKSNDANNKKSVD